MQFSIIIPIYDQWQLTRICLGALQRHTPPGNWEVIAVDNGSTDGVGAWLDQVSLGLTPIRVIHNRENLGFAAACNQGLAAASGEACVLLNNDVVVTPGWLDGLWAPMAQDPSVGLTGPMSNFALPAQCCDNGPREAQPAALEAFAQARRQQYLGSGRAVELLSGFCLVIRRRVLETIGGLDHRFGLGYYEDTDYCLRAGLAGFHLRICDDVYVHHFGSQTMMHVVPDREAAMNEKYRLFCDKWRLPYDTKRLTCDVLKAHWSEPMPLFAPIEPLAPAT